MNFYIKIALFWGYILIYMDEIFELANIELTSTSYVDFIIGLITNAFYILLIRKIYLTFSKSVSNKHLISNLFLIFGTSIFLIVITIKSSIVLSLGLVGALSIIRFRTAIKEPEQIIYFLLITGISISSAAGSFLFPVFIISTIYIYLKIIKKDIEVLQNDQIVITTEKLDNDIFRNLIEKLNIDGVNVEIQSINKSYSSQTYVLKVSDFKYDHLTTIEKYLEKEVNIAKTEVQYFSSTE